MLNKNNKYQSIYDDLTKVWLIDLDNTIYKANYKIMEDIDRKIEEYIIYKCRCTSKEARFVRNEIFCKYKNTFYGLLNEKVILKKELTEFLEYAHNINVPKRFKANSGVKDILEKIKGNKYVFTNGTKTHADRIVGMLDIAHLFDGIFSIEDFDYSFKPNKKPFQIVKDKFKKQFKDLVLVDDSWENIETAKSLGLSVFAPEFFHSN